MGATGDFKVIFRGVRGSIPMATPKHMGFGGNTTCVEVRCGYRTLIFDMGTGCYALGKQLMQEPGSQDIDVFLSHTHLDHIMGFPFFRPLYRKGARLRLWAGHLASDAALRGVFETLLHPPIFPLRLSDLKASLSFHTFSPGDTVAASHLAAEGITVKTHALNHPDGATAYRVNYQGRSFCFVTDVEHPAEGPDEGLIDFVKDADVLTHDSTYDAESIKTHRGWGHSAWEDALHVAERGNVKLFFPFHHDPDATDDQLERRSRRLQSLKPGSTFAYEGLEVDVMALKVSGAVSRIKQS